MPGNTNTFVLSFLFFTFVRSSLSSNLSENAATMLAVNTFSGNVSASVSGASHDDRNSSHGGIHVASWRFDYVKYPLLITAFIMYVSIVKIVFHHVHRIYELFPESCMLIVLGVLIGLLFLIPSSTVTDLLEFLSFNSKSFFLYLLPPIILEAAYSLKDRAFYANFGTIILYAVVGTLLNIVMVGGILASLLAVGAMGSLRISYFEVFVFASLIAAVDPVAVLAIFQEVGVNEMLYFMVFGESLFNDAVTVVAYNLMVDYTEIGFITLSSAFLGMASFLCVVFGAIGFGFFWGSRLPSSLNTQARFEFWSRRQCLVWPICLTCLQKCFIFRAL